MESLAMTLIRPQDITGDMSFLSGSHVEGCRALLIQREASSFTSSSASDLILSVVIQTVSRHLQHHLTS